MPNCACGIPNRANWHVSVVLTRPHSSGHGTETTDTDIYTCDEHFPGYPDGSMSDSDVRSMLAWDGHEQWTIHEHHATRLR